MRLDEGKGKGERIWECSRHAAEQFIKRNRFLKEGEYRQATIILLKMMEKAKFICYEDRDKIAEIWESGKWILITKESTIVTVYLKKGSMYEHKTNY